MQFFAVVASSRCHNGLIANLEYLDAANSILEGLEANDLVDEMQSFAM